MPQRGWVLDWREDLQARPGRMESSLRIVFATIVVLVAMMVLGNSSSGWLCWQQGFDRLTAAVVGNRSCEIGQGIQFSEITSFGNGQQASGG